MSSYQKDHPETIQALFASVASRYDKTNAIASLGLHRYWNRQLVNALLNHSLEGSYLDLCAGTGAIALSFLKRCKKPPETYLLDFCPEMLAIAKLRAKELADVAPTSLHFLHADARAIPLESSSVNTISTAYGVRNISDRIACFQDAYRVLQPGGLLAILELTQPEQYLLKKLHRLYLQLAIPVIGKCCTSNKEAYRYLCNSIQGFISPQTLHRELEAVGFACLPPRPLTGGIAHLFLAHKQMATSQATET